MNCHKRNVMKFVALLVLCVFVWGEVEVRCIEREREALASFKNGLSDDLNILSSWQQTHECCEWYGVVCSNTTRHVIRLELGTIDFDVGLGGKVSSSLLELRHLTYLDLSWNDFGGGRIPEFIGSMRQLQHLFLGDSNFAGIIPPRIQNLTNLRSLDLSHNYVRIENLEWLSSLSLLTLLDLSQIDVSRTNSLRNVSSLHSLRKLYLKSCNIGDVKPSTFGWLSNVSTSLVRLDMSNNALGGLIPNALEKLNLVEHLDLSSNMLKDDVIYSLSNTSHLRVLVLYENELTAHLKDFIGNLSLTLASLEILDLARNHLTGSLPDFRPFSALTELYLGSNRITGFMPLSLGQLSRLSVLEVSNNYLEGTVSESHFTKLQNLETLDLTLNSLKLHIAPDQVPPFRLDGIFLAGCNVGPSFPKWIQTQRNLSALDLSGTGIIDEVPTWLWSFSLGLEDLFLRHNQISGTIPDLSSTSIIRIDVTSNRFFGPIPLFHKNFRTIQLNQNMFSGSISSLCKSPHDQLKYLGLSSNHLSGELPDCWGSMPNLLSLDLANNSFWGKIPRSFGSLHDAVALQLRDNNLSGELPSTLRFLRELHLFDVGGNKLTGEIPAWIGEIHFHYLNLGGNRLRGSIPPGICSLTHIQILDISTNNLSGKIPDCFNNFTTLAQKNTSKTFSVFGSLFGFQYNPELPNAFIRYYNEYSLVGWKGQESEYRRNLIFLKLIDLSSNGLTGNIPGSLSSMKGLRSLNLSRNSLTGKIIPDIGEMEMLESLDLSNNHLSGEIPKSLAQLQYLSVLALSDNNLSGEIPSGTQLQSFHTSSYDRNNGLCGAPLEMCPENGPRPATPTHGEKDCRLWRFTFMQEVGISMAFGWIVGFWGVVGSLVLKKSWRYAYFNFLDGVGDWWYVTTTIFLSKWRRK